MATGPPGLQSHLEYRRAIAWLIRSAVAIFVPTMLAVAVHVLWPSLPSAFILVPFYLLAAPSVIALIVAFVHLAHSGALRRREARQGTIQYTNAGARWVDTHGVAIGAAISAIIIVAVVVAKLLAVRH